MIDHPVACTCPDCCGPIVLDLRRITLGFAGLLSMLVWLWLTWIMLPA